MKHAQDLDIIQHNNITRIITIGVDMDPLFEANGVTYLIVPIPDSVEVNIKKEFAKCIEFIEASNENILIHCAAGISRSSTICIAYLMQNRRWTLDRAFSFVKDKRPRIDPNLSFYMQLQEWEKELDQMFAD